MKLRNKKTGEIKNINHGHVLLHFNDGETKCIKSINQLNEDWEDYEEPKEYWCIDWDGGINHIDLLGNPEGDHEEKKKQIGNYFETREEAEKELARRKAYVILKEDTKGFKPDWKNENEKKYYVVYDYGSDKFVSEWREVYNGGEKLYFATQEDAEASVKAHEKDWKTWLGVKYE